MGRTWLLVALSIAGCGDDGTTEGSSSGGTGGAPPSQAPADGTFESGERLRAHFLDGGDGATYFLNWKDTTVADLRRVRMS